MNRTKNKHPVAKLSVSKIESLQKLEARYRHFPENELMPLARNTSFKELAAIIPDRNPKGSSKYYLYESRHTTTIGVDSLARKTQEFLESQKKDMFLEILSVSAGMLDDKICVTALVRMSEEDANRFRFSDIYQFLGEDDDDDSGEDQSSSRLIIPKSAIRTYSEAEIEHHFRAVNKQNEILAQATPDKPFLNSIDTYTAQKLYDIDERQELIYNLRTKDMNVQLNTSYDNFIRIFNNCMNYITTAEKDSYYNVLREQIDKQTFFDVIEAYIQRTFIMPQKLPNEDLPALMKKLDRALFQLYIVQDLIDEPEITDIKITDPYSIRVRIKGNAFLSNVTFIDADDYIRFINGIAIVNSVDLKIPTQTFTYEQDENYILRFSITAPYITCSGYPIIHIRKLSRKKQMADDLIRAGMFDEKIRDYLLDCGKFSRGVVFSGPPGSGKTTCLNWFLEEAYESSAEILVIQENDELFSYRKGVMFEHVVLNPQRGERPCSLEQLGQMALVAGANVFVIGEAKGAEICSAITLSNSGCRTAITIHAQSSTDTIDKMVDLALRGEQNTTYEQAKRMIKSFQTIVYLDKYKVQEISEIIGYDDVKKDMIYRSIYKREKT